MALPGSPQHDFPLLFFLHQQASPPKLVSLSDLPQTSLKTSLYLALSIPLIPCQKHSAINPKISLNPYVQKTLHPCSSLTTSMPNERSPEYSSRCPTLIRSLIPLLWFSSSHPRADKWSLKVPPRGKLGGRQLQEWPKMEVYKYIDWIYIYIYWKFMLECGGKWDIVSDFFLCINIGI